MSVQILESKLVQTLVAALRNKETPPEVFRVALHNLSLLLAALAAEHLTLFDWPIQTPLEPMTATRFRQSIALCPIMRAGAGMEPAFRTFFPSAATWHISMSRNPQTLEPEFHGSKIPSKISQSNWSPICFVLDPMLATAGSACLAIQKLKDAGAQNIVFVGIFAAPEGLDWLQQTHPDVPVVLAILDRQLNDVGYILPGCGDAGDRLNGTEH